MLCVRAEILHTSLSIYTYTYTYIYIYTHDLSLSICTYTNNTNNTVNNKNEHASLSLSIYIYIYTHIYIYIHLCIVTAPVWHVFWGGKPPHGAPNIFHTGGSVVGGAAGDFCSQRSALTSAKRNISQRGSRVPQSWLVLRQNFLRTPT